MRSALVGCQADLTVCDRDAERGDGLGNRADVGKAQACAEDCRGIMGRSHWRHDDDGRRELDDATGTSESTSA
jgi:hypothetical protein